MSDEYKIKPRWISGPGSRNDSIDVKRGAPERSSELPTKPEWRASPSGRKLDAGLDAPPSQEKDGFGNYPREGAEDDCPAKLLGPGDAALGAEGSRSPTNPSPWEMRRRELAPGVDDPRPQGGAPGTTFATLGRIWRAIRGR